MEYKTFFLFLKLLVNILTPIYILNKKCLLFYFLTYIPLSLALLYIFVKKRIYKGNFVFKPYIPSLGLVILIQICDIISLLAFYYKIWYLNIDATKLKIISAIHGILTLIIYIVILFQKNKSKKLVSSVRHTFKLGIVLKDIGNRDNGLSKDQPVEVVSEEGDRCKVYDGKDFFLVNRQDIEIFQE